MFKDNFDKTFNIYFYFAFWNRDSFRICKIKNHYYKFNFMLKITYITKITLMTACSEKKIKQNQNSLKEELKK